MPLQPRENIARFHEGVHGGYDYAEFGKLGIDPGTVIDFSVSTNPLGMPAGISRQASTMEISKYPDSRSMRLVGEISRATGIDEDTILVGAGSTELIRLAVTAYAGENDSVLIVGPTYGEYRTAGDIAGAEIISCDATEQDDFIPDIGKTIELIKRVKPKLIFICNPNNPTGYYCKRETIQTLLAAAPDSLVVVDEAYAAFVDERWDSNDLIANGNLLIIRSMTKDYAIAGLRLGYAVSNRNTIDVLRKIAPPWNVNILAQKAGIEVLRQDGYLARSRNVIGEGKRYMTEEIEKLGFRCIPSAANFFLIETGNAAEFRRRLLGKNILVRDCTSFGLPGFIRIATLSMNKNRKLIAALKEIKNER